MTQSEFSRKIKSSRQTVSRMKKEEVLTFENGKINFKKSIETLQALGRVGENGNLINKKTVSDTVKENQSELLYYKKRLTIERALLTALKRKKLESRLVEISEIEKIINIFTTPIIKNIQKLPNSFKKKKPNAEQEMILYLEEFTNEIILMMSQNINLKNV